MTLFFKSKPSELGCDSGNSPPSSPIWGGELQTEEEDEEEFDGFEAYDPISTPFISPGFDKNNDNDIDNKNNNNGSGQFPILAFVATALRKSLLVTCSVEREDHESLSDAPPSMEISCPTNVRHVSHVTFDRFRGFLGLPDEFQPEILKRVPSASASVFGVSPQSMQCSIDERGNSVPTILLRMQKRLYAEGGLQAEGIFRLTAENSQEEKVRSQLNKGIVPHGIDVHCLAGLIKAWLRELPQGVLDCLTPEQVMECNTEDECTQLVKLLPPMEAALLDWAINLMADVAQNEQVNKMNARNIAMVFAPNMTQMADPLTALIHAVQVMNFLKTLIVKTLQLREQAAEKARLLSSSSESCEITISNSQKSVSFGELLSESHQESSNKLLRSVTLDRLECNPEKKQGTNTANGDQVLSKKLLRSVTLDRLERDPETKQETSTPNGDQVLSKKISRSVTLDRDFGDDDREVEAGISERLNFRKGVKKLCRHPVFQLSKATKKTTELGIVDSR